MKIGLWRLFDMVLIYIFQYLNSLVRFKKQQMRAAEATAMQTLWGFSSLIMLENLYVVQVTLLSCRQIYI